MFRLISFFLGLASLVLACWLSSEGVLDFVETLSGAISTRGKLFGHGLPSVLALLGTILAVFGAAGWNQITSFLSSLTRESKYRVGEVEGSAALPAEGINGESFLTLYPATGGKIQIGAGGAEFKTKLLRGSFVFEKRQRLDVAAAHLLALQPGQKVSRDCQLDCVFCLWKRLNWLTLYLVRDLFWNCISVAKV